MALDEVMPEPALKERLSTRIVTSSIAALLFVLAMIGWTLWLSWQLEGAGAAINDTGSLRMRANLIGIELLKAEAVPSARVVRAQAALDAQHATLERLRRGVPSRPLFLPQDEAIRAQFERVTALWQRRLQPAAVVAMAGGARASYLSALPNFVDEADRLVRMIEVDNAGKTSLLRLSQGLLVVLACAGTLAMIYLLYLWIISPVLRLQDGLGRMAAREFGVRLPVESRDEFGVLAAGFNRMAEELEALYRELETRVATKTAQLAARNRELETLYDMAAFLHQPNDIDTLCRGFLKEVRRQFHADGGSIRAVDPEGEKLLMVVADGLTPALAEHEHCMKVDDCFCGQATQQGVVVIHDLRRLPQPDAYQCSKEGFTSLAVFRIVSRDEVLGSFSLHFRDRHALSEAETQLLETLGRHLGVALENRRLAAKARQLAVAQERSLVAQGLHDSIAQGLNFLNLQVQLLEDALARGALDDATEIAPLLRTGVEESYQDVRELLSNFRSKLAQGELVSGIEETASRFTRQTGIEVALDVRDEGAPLPPEQQLQVLFILQEALSNVRKHAQAGKVWVQMRNQRDFVLKVRDDGQGYDPDEVARRSEQHVGLSIMRERAGRIGAELTLTSRPGAGVQLALTLDQARRQAA
ncbi:type IV pili methyl-accepting chemotaxis transducer N-terminal domain-containing protein [Chitiniphilus purpureus]|uniref:Sensor protein n=1 Tax=Chitiniphilus purpureus TaxID=2981137 RepID=A0ABY6DRZ8_9NEIS|nr:type IV pili methyl-accepting chemotaxis transducer N-terminal domain-containing protein [Chitiniphilus sp. CD1]UXY15861.1 type IV pili methyl-accepting chemotaxis transducer N-terminal domain-containing protein [Chitiniphilus sp. CD1]